MCRQHSQPPTLAPASSLETLTLTTFDLAPSSSPHLTRSHPSHPSHPSCSQVHELGASDLPRSFVIQGRKAYTTAQIRDHLGVSPRRGSAGVAGAVVGGPGPVAAPVADGATPGGGVAGQPGKFLAPLGECEYAVNTILDNLGPDPWPSVAEHRLLRCAGSALQVASAILSGSVPPGGGECRRGLRGGVGDGGACVSGNGSNLCCMAVDLFIDLTLTTAEFVAFV